MARSRKTKGTWGGWRPGAGAKPKLDDPVLTSVTLERKQSDRIRALAKRRGVSVSEVVRHAVDAYLRRRKS